VEQDPLHVVGETRAALEEVIGSVHSEGHQVVAIGLASQRSSFILWDREEGRAFTPIISWQDLRAKDLCEAFRAQGAMIYQKTGLPLTGHYGGPKFQWLAKNDPRTLKWTDRPKTVFSPWSSFLLWHLTEERLCVVDESIAGRTLFFNIHQRGWDAELLDLFQIPRHILPEIRPTCHLFGHYRSRDRSIPIACVLGDHQGALFGLGGIEQGACGLNYGTSAGFLSNLGHRPHIVNGLLTNIAYSTRSEANYTAEGTVNAVGSLFEWFEKEHRISGASKGWEEMVAPSSQGWYMLPGMYGIAAPYWKETAPTEFKGEGPTPPPNVLLRAGMESIAFLVADIFDRLGTIPDFKIDRVTAAGGAARPPLLQVQADLLGLPILHSSVSDATALGCAFLTGLQTGFWKGAAEVRNLIRSDETYSPRISPTQRQMLLVGWHDFLKEKSILS
jgi:glycerol kinase